MNTLQAKSYTGSIENDYIERKIFSIMFLALALVAGLYVYFLGTTVFNVIARQSMENQVKTLSSNVGQLELQYLSLNNGVDLARATSLGFVEPKNGDIQFASRETYVSTTLGTRANEL